MIRRPLVTSVCWPKLAIRTVKERLRLHALTGCALEQGSVQRIRGGNVLLDVLSELYEAVHVPNTPAGDRAKGCAAARAGEREA
eukprot:6174047-Pleurochrysis_carterae.AAC.4